MYSLPRYVIPLLQRIASTVLPIVVFGACCVSPSAIALPFAYIANGSSPGALAIVDTANGTALNPPISVGAYPSGVAVSPDGRFAYVGNVYDKSAGIGPGSVSFVSTASRSEERRVEVGNQPQGIAVHPNGQRVYVANVTDGTLSVLNTLTGETVATIAVGGSPNGVALSPDGALVYVGIASGLIVIDSITNTVKMNLNLGTIGAGVTASPDGQYVYLTVAASAAAPGHLYVILVQTFAVVARIQVGVYPNGLAVAPNGGRVYVGNGTDNSVSVVDVPSLAVVATIPVGKFPFGIAVTPAGDVVYVTNNGDATISVLSTAENKVVNTIKGLGGVTSFGKFIGPAEPLGNVAVEYFNSGFGHYFITAIPDEIAKLDAGIFNGWTRTGEQFHVQSSPGTGAGPVCRFFTVAFAPKSSHFYAPRGLGCEPTCANVDWLFEGDVFFASLPDANGICALASLPVYRLYNNGQGGAPNHRFTTNPAIRTQMIGLGYTPEGPGAGVGWCSPR